MNFSNYKLLPNQRARRLSIWKDGFVHHRQLLLREEDCSKLSNATLFAIDKGPICLRH
jgi:hypothetical protein